MNIFQFKIVVLFSKNDKNMLKNEHKNFCANNFAHLQVSHKNFY